MLDLTPQPPRWYSNPEPVKVRVERVERGPFPDEVAVTIRINGDVISVLVPADMVIDGLVQGLKIGETSDRVLIALPPSTISNPPLWILKSLEAEVVAA